MIKKNKQYYIALDIAYKKGLVVSLEFIEDIQMLGN